MIKFFDGRIDERHTLTTHGLNYMQALQINSDGTTEWVFYKDRDDFRYDLAEVIYDATKEEIQMFKQKNNIIEQGDKVQITLGRKMVNEIKEVKEVYTYRPQSTYGLHDVTYLLFTDGTKVAKRNCQLYNI